MLLRNNLSAASALKQLKPIRAVGDIVQKHWAPRFAFIPAVVAGNPALKERLI
jgi:hypothetical protein